MPTLEEIRKARLAKLESLKRTGFLAYPSKTKRSHQIKDALQDFNKLAKSKKEIVIAGRLMSQRGHGKLFFGHIQDGQGKIQILFRQNLLGESKYEFIIDHFDIGDIIEVKGILFKTKTGERTLEASEVKILAKSLLPLPEKWHGLTDVEERFRKRYLDILMNPEVKAMVEKKAVFWQSMREFLLARGFLEVETPVLETVPGGADAKAFSTRHNALNMEVFLRISMGELWQKRLMVAGLEKTFEIGRQFRNEGMDQEHLQDYTQMEFYWAYADYRNGMKLVEEMYKEVAKKTFGTLKFNIHGFEVDLAKKWEKYDYVSTVQKYTGVNVLDAGIKEIEAKMKKLNIEYDKKGFNFGRAMDNLWKYCRKKIAGPGFLINVPVIVSPLAKKSEKNPTLTQRFQVIIGGSELGNGYSELNDPLEQADRFKEQQKLRDQGDEEAQMYDKDFIEALEYGMPPTCGFGVSERFFSALMGKSARECQIFPLMKLK
ncbi:lysine--tRNA ligase [Candidatus Parcubacteria bacterium]|nr:lysine--tRNA ligase [Patescibacteria group bacterium]MBU4466835.1 lysine--tRNA ligase [Patescibacteria group bacterium]MCG2688782.1 lysine--tRNA ligase [Candidatus Parcubacteria bacterium]